MPAADVLVKGAREHNLQSVNVRLPRNQLICLTGVSGSGKSSLAFDTVYAEGQRRYIESLSSYARQFLGQMPKPDVDQISGLSPTISISQKSSGQNPRSTVGTITEIYDYLRVLYARVAQGHCPDCRRPLEAQSRDQIIARIADMEGGAKLYVLAPIIRGQKGEYKDLFEELLKQGFVRARVDGQVVSLNDDLSLDRKMRHNIEVVVDRLVAGKEKRSRLAEAVELALRTGDGELIVAPEDGKPTETPAEPTKRKGGRSSRTTGVAGDIRFSSDYACIPCGKSFNPPSPQLFSFNSPQGMCVACDGLGEFYSFDSALLIPDDTKSFKKGAIELLGSWKDLGRWKRHIYQGVADTMERKLSLAEGTFLDTPWNELAADLQLLLLWGTDEEHITFTWRGGNSGSKHGGTFEGIIPELVNKYRNSHSKPQIRQLEKYMNVIVCPDCQGRRLNPQASAATVITANDAFGEHRSRSLPEVCQLPVTEAVAFFEELVLDATGAKIASEALKEIRGRLGFLREVGLEYLSLARTAPTLSGGESQRIRLAGQIGCGLVGVLYILDEPSIGLHPRDNDRLLDTLNSLRDMGNTVVVVEHDEDTMRAADHIIDFGPGPGVRGGHVVARGDVDEVMTSQRSVTGHYLSGQERIEVPDERRNGNGQSLTIRGATHNNLKNIDVAIPLGTFVCVTGVSGSGKSSLISDILVESLREELMGGKGEPGEHAKIDGIDELDKMIAIDQSPIGRTPRSNPATYVKLFDEIRKLYTQLPDAKRRGYKPGRFSFNVAEGRCEACDGNGSNKLEMDFLAPVWVTCPVCQGHRFNRETLQVRFKGKSIADVLEMDVQQALDHFENVPNIARKVQTLHDVGLDYMKVGQPSPTLSGGEAQRIKLARELAKKSTGKTLYILDEPTTGLHFADIKMLLKVLHGIVDAGNTVLVVEHNLDVVKTADWVIDLGPEGGAAGGKIVAQGTPEEVAQVKASHTGRALKPVLQKAKQKTVTKPKAAKKPKRRKVGKVTESIIVQGARQHNLKDIDVEIPRDQMTVLCGMSGSGKTSLAMDTIYAEGQRRYVESLGSYARQFVAQMQKPQVEHITGLSPSIAIEQKHMGHTPRSTVGTVTEIYDYLRILFTRLGTPYCPDCNVPIGTQTSDEIVDKIMAHPEGSKLYLMAPLSIGVGEKYETLIDDVRSRGYVRIRLDGKTFHVDEIPAIDRRRRHALELIVDRITVRPQNRSRVAESVEAALAISDGIAHTAVVDEDRPEPKWKVKKHSQHYACDRCHRSFEPLTPHSFSFNTWLGWCENCEGLGTEIGANLNSLVRDGKLTLAEGAVAVWPDAKNRLFAAMLAALAKQTDVPADVPLDALSARQRRIVLYGSDQWINVFPPGRHKKGATPLFRFQYKGLYPALDEASRLSARFRGKLEHLLDEVACSACAGSRLRDDAASVQLRSLTIDELCRMPLDEFAATITGWELTDREKKIAGELLREITQRTQFMLDVGLDYLSLTRSAPTLSGGESQRIRLASQVGSGLCGVLYVLDEPTIGLHPRDNRRLLTALEKLRDLGNTLLVVEHDREVVQAADRLLDFGPAAGEHGGEIVAQGTPAAVAKQRGSVTGPYLSGKKAIVVPSNRRMKDENAEGGVKSKTQKANNKRKKKGDESLRPESPSGAWLEIIGARHNNLHNVDIALPLGAFTAVTGVSGSGKSSLIEDVLYSSLAKTLHRAGTVPAPHDEIRGIQHINKVIRVDQQPLGNSPTSNPATYTGLFDLVRSLFSQLPDSKVRGYTPRRFSFNVSGGRCEECEGAGQQCIEMHFLPDVWVECDTCKGHRYNSETLEVKFHGNSIADVLELSCERALELFKNIPKVRRILDTLCDVGLDYVKLGQPAPTLSGGEAQRVKLAAELSRPDTGQTLYLLDEPTTGLHFDDLVKLLEVLNRLVDLGNTVVVIEHNLDVIKTADWVIDMGPEAGDEGGNVVVCGTPEAIVEHAAAYNKQPAAKRTTKTTTKKKTPAKTKKPTLHRSYTGEALTDVLAAGPHRKRAFYDFAEAQARRDGDQDITQVGRGTKMPWEIDGEAWHTRDRVDRKGAPCRWEGELLRQVIERIHAKGKFSDTDWNARSVVEISANKKSDGWFFHALTGETWLVKLKFRVAKRTFQRSNLVERIGLTPLNEVDELPVYGTGPRVRVKTLRGPWQEVEVQAHSLEEINTDEFWQFLDEAIDGFVKITERIQQKPEDMMPWKVMGERWHFSRKGFPPGKTIRWKTSLLEELHAILADTAPQAQFLWNNQQVVHQFVTGQKEAWASLHTKRLAALELVLTGPRGQFALGRVAELGAERELVSDGGTTDQIKIRFVAQKDLDHGDLAEFLREHFDSLNGETVPAG